MIYMRDSAVRIGPLAVKFYDLCAFWMVVLTLVLSAAKHAVCNVFISFAPLACPIVRKNLANVLGFICLVELALRTAITLHHLARHTAEFLSSAARLAVTQAECNMYKAELQRLSKVTSIARNHNILMVLSLVESRQKTATLRKAFHIHTAKFYREGHALKAQNLELGRERDELRQEAESFRGSCTVLLRGLEMADARECKLNSQYCTARNDNATLKSKNALQIKRISELESRAVLLEEQDRLLADTLAKATSCRRSQASHIDKLRAQRDRRDARILSLGQAVVKFEATIAERDCQVERLRSQQTKQCEGFTRVLNERDAEIEELGAKMRRQSLSTAGTEEHVRRLEQQVAELQDALAAHQPGCELQESVTLTPTNHASMNPFNDANAVEESDEESDSDLSSDGGESADSSSDDTAATSVLDDEPIAIVPRLVEDRALNYIRVVSYILDETRDPKTTDDEILAHLFDADPAYCVLTNKVVGKYFKQSLDLDHAAWPNRPLCAPGSEREHLGVALVTAKRRLQAWVATKRPDLVRSTGRVRNADDRLRNYLQLAGSTLPMCDEDLSLDATMKRPLAPLVHRRLAALRFSSL